VIFKGTPSNVLVEKSDVLKKGRMHHQFAFVVQRDAIWITLCPEVPERLIQSSIEQLQPDRHVCLIKRVLGYVVAVSLVNSAKESVGSRLCSGTRLRCHEELQARKRLKAV
jgi:hypothetical protein